MKVLKFCQFRHPLFKGNLTYYMNEDAGGLYVTTPLPSLNHKYAPALPTM